MFVKSHARVYVVKHNHYWLKNKLYSILFVLFIIGYLIFSSYKATYTCGLVNENGVVYATVNYNGEITELELPHKLSKQDYINYDCVNLQKSK